MKRFGGIGRSEVPLKEERAFRCGVRVEAMQTCAGVFEWLAMTIFLFPFTPAWLFRVLT